MGCPSASMENVQPAKFSRDDARVRTDVNMDGTEWDGTYSGARVVFKTEDEYVQVS